MKNEVEFVELKECVSRDCHGTRTDLFCVSCKKWICSRHMKYCVQCEQPVCEGCYVKDLCCLVSPWGKTTEEHLKKFYENKLVDGEGMNVIAAGNAIDQQKGSKCFELRMEAVKRSVEFYVDNFDDSFASCYKTSGCDILIAKCFSRIFKYMEHEETRFKFVDFIKKIAERLSSSFAYILVYSEDREELISKTEELIRNNDTVLSELIDLSLEENGKPLFDCLKNRGLLDWSKAESIRIFFVGHIDGMKWIESNGIDVENSKERYERFARYASKEVKEYLASKGEKMIEYLISDDFLYCDGLEIIYKFKGLKAIQSINVEKMRFYFKEVKFLKSIGYKFDKGKILSVSRDLDQYYARLCFNVLKYEEFDEDAKSLLKDYTSNHEQKACKQMYPFMKEIRKKKIMTVLICMRKIPLSYPLPKEIIWNILDYAYSPINERGSL